MADNNNDRSERSSWWNFISRAFTYRPKEPKRGIQEFYSERSEEGEE